MPSIPHKRCQRKAHMLCIDTFSYLTRVRRNNTQKKRILPKQNPLLCCLFRCNRRGYKVIPQESKWSAWNPNSNAVVILCKSHYYRALEGNFYLLQNKRQSSFFQSVTQVSHILLTYVPTYILKADRRLDFELLF